MEMVGWCRGASIVDMDEDSEEVGEGGWKCEMVEAGGWG